MTQTLNNSSTDKIIYTLSIQVSLNGLSFCVSDTEGQIIFLNQDNFGIQLTPEQVLDKIKYALDHHPELQITINTIEIIYQNNLYAIVPKTLFDPNLLKEYLQFNIKILATDFIAYDEMDQHELVSVYIPYTNINNFFFETFGSFTYKHSTTVLIDSLLTKEKNNDRTTVYAHMGKKSFDLIVIKKGKLILCNSYRYETSEDFIYYLMFTAEQLGLNPEEFKLLFLGHIDKDSDCYTLAYTYVRHVDIGSRSDTVRLSDRFSDIATHEHFVILSHF